MDNFYEQLERKHHVGTYNFLKVSFIFFLVVGLFIVVLSPPIGIFFIIIGVITFFLKKKFYTEYEYTFTNGAIDIDAIYEARKRKHVSTFEIKDAELVAPLNSDYVKDFSNKPEKILNCVVDDTDKKVFTVMLTKGASRLQLKFTPDEKFLDLCFRYNPRAVKKY